MNVDVVIKEFEKNNGILKTSNLKEIGITSRQVNKLINENIISRIKFGYYILENTFIPEEIIIRKLFPKAIMYLESALIFYDYTDRIPDRWQIAVDKNTEKSKFKLNYPFIKPFYLEPKILNIGVTSYIKDGIKIRIYDRDRTICDILRYEKKIDREIFAKAIKSYIMDNKKNIQNLFYYAKILNIKNKVQRYIGVWL
jgi:predicted transcriptional regulator of viral defense system